MGFTVLILGAVLAASPALAGCSHRCKTHIAAASRACKRTCPKGKTRRACSEACGREKKITAAACRAADEPTPPDCGIACGTFLGRSGSSGSGDGQFLEPIGVAVDASGNVFVADAKNSRIQKLTNAGTFLTTWGSAGSGNGQFGQLNGPVGIAVDHSGNIFVADHDNSRIQKFTDTGTFLMAWGSPGGGDGQFLDLQGVVVDRSGNVFVIEGDHPGCSRTFCPPPQPARIQKFTSSGTFLATWGSFGPGDGQFDFPRGVAVDASGNVFAVEVFNDRIQKFSNVGAFLLTFGWGVQDGMPTYERCTAMCRSGIVGSGDGQFEFPEGVGVDGSGNVFVADTDNHRIQTFTDTGTFLAKWGSEGGGDGQFEFPRGVAVDGSGNVFVADAGNDRIQKFACRQVRTHKRAR